MCKQKMCERIKFERVKLFLLYFGQSKIELGSNILYINDTRKLFIERVNEFKKNNLKINEKNKSRY